MAYWDQTDLENALSPATVLAIYDDTASGVVSTDALTAVIKRSDAEVNSYMAINYPKLVLPLADAPTPDTLKFASLEFGIVYSRDRKPEYWKNAQDKERENRLAEARKKMDRFAVAQQVLFDVPAQPRPSNVGGIVLDQGQRVTIDSITGESNMGDF